MYTRKQLEEGTGFYVAQHTVIFQRGDEDVFVTGQKSDIPNTREGWHIAGGGRLWANGEAHIEWCDLR